MIPEPTTFPTNNTHRVALFLPDHRADIDKIDDIGADAIRAAREAMAHIEELPYEERKVAASHEKALKSAVGKRRVLNDDFRHAAEVMLRHLARIEPGAEHGEHLWRASAALRDSVNASHRVADLLAAEKDIGWHRGIGR